MSKSKRLQPKWTQKHKDYMRHAEAATIAVAEGAVRAGKTVDNVAVFARMIDRGVPDRIHLATGSTAANAKLNIGDCNGFGLEYIFRGRCRWTKFKGNEALVIKSHGRDYVVIFAGGAKADSFKKIRGNSYGMWIATEINLHHQNTIHEAFNRQLAAKVRKVLWDLNPESPASSIYTEYIDKFPEQYGSAYCYEHFTIRDNASVSPQRLQEIVAQYDPNSIWFRRDIEGQRCNAEGLVYDMFRRERHVVEKTPETEGDYFVSSDYGIQNPNVFLLWRRVKGTNHYICLRECYYSGREERRQKTDAELVEMMVKMLGGIEPACVIIDPSAASMIAQLQRSGYPVMKADNSVKPGISNVASMLTEGRLLFAAECARTIEEFGLYSWDEKAAQHGDDAPLKINDHSMDAVRYFVQSMNLVSRTETKEYTSVFWG